MTLEDRLEEVQLLLILNPQDRELRELLKQLTERAQNEIRNNDE